MNERSSTPAHDTLDWLAGAFRRQAAAVGLEARDEPALEAGSFGGGEGSAAASLETRDLPFARRGLAIGRHALVLGLLPEFLDDRELAESMRRHRNQCLVARSFLTLNAALDLQLIMVGPRGSEGKDAWRATALAVERDERVARKLVWLRPGDPMGDEASFRSFAKRTFLARPWATSARFSMAPLDNLTTIGDAGEVPRDTASKWTRLAIELGDDPASLVDGLVSVWAERSAT